MFQFHFVSPCLFLSFFIILITLNYFCSSSLPFSLLSCLVLVLVSSLLHILLPLGFCSVTELRLMQSSASAVLSFCDSHYAYCLCNHFVCSVEKTTATNNRKAKLTRLMGKVKHFNEIVWCRVNTCGKRMHVCMRACIRFLFYVGGCLVFFKLPFWAQIYVFCARYVSCEGSPINMFPHIFSKEKIMS